MPEQVDLLQKVMHCNACHILINGYVDGELTDEEMHELKTHLQTCKACVAYLKRMEAMKTVLRRYTLLQNVPEVSPNFARNVSAKLQAIAAKEDIALGTQLKQKYRQFVGDLTEKWISSLRTRPAIWITAVSCLGVFIAGIVLVNLFFVLEKQLPVQYTKAITETISPTETHTIALEEAQSDKGAEVAPEPASRSGSQEIVAAEEEPIEYVEIAPESVIQIAKSDEEVEKMFRYSMIKDASRDQLTDDIVEMEELAVTAKSFIQLTTVGQPLVEDYIYSHVIGISQDQFMDDALFVRYVQNGFH